MAKIENRTVRIEDWQGNRYFPIGKSDSSTSGTVSDSTAASTDKSDNTYTDGTKTSDSSANNGSSIVLTSSSTRQILYSTMIANIPFGSTSITYRIKSSKGSGTINLLEVNTYFVDTSGTNPKSTKVHTQTINGDQIGTPNQYVGLGHVVDFKGTVTGSYMMKVEFIVLPDTGATLYFDNMAVSLAPMSADSANKAFVDQTTVVLP
jgi:hypothetical protein